MRRTVARQTARGLGVVAAAIGLALSTAAPAGAATPTIANGGFEDPSISPNVYRTLPSGETIGAWKVTNGSVDILHTRFRQAAEGDQLVDLNGLEPGTIEQSFDTLPLTKYIVTFSVAGDPDYQGVSSARMKVNGKTVKNFSFDSTGKTATDMGYKTVTGSFTASGFSSTLAFEALTPPGAAGIVVDKVRVQPCLLILCL